jgi:hypothetical protein
LNKTPPGWSVGTSDSGWNRVHRSVPPGLVLAWLHQASTSFVCCSKDLFIVGLCCFRLLTGTSTVTLTEQFVVHCGFSSDMDLKENMLSVACFTSGFVTTLFTTTNFLCWKHPDEGFFQCPHHPAYHECTPFFSLFILVIH